MNKRQINTLIKDYSTLLKSREVADFYCEKILTAMGAKNVYSMDASDFEGATYVCDLNEEVGDE